MNWEDELKKKIITMGNSPNIDNYIRVDDVNDFIESLLKQQREICMKEYQKSYQKGYTEISVNIDNAPEPTGEKK